MTANSLTIETFKNVLQKLPPHIAVLVKGPTGIGKSHIIHQIAKKYNLPVLDKRLAYMTEGDIIGLPELIDGVTRFAPVDWIVKACNEPVALFLDELNRATNEVQQCAFQLVLDREMNGHKLHPETRIYVAVNEGSDYQVSEMDPALLRRFYVADLEPTNEDWYEWARKNSKTVDPIILEFLTKYPAHLRHTGEFEPGKVYPNPASWARLSETLIYSNMSPSSCLGENYDPLIFSIASGFIGTSTTPAFCDFLMSYKVKFSADDIFNNYSKVKADVNKLTNDKKNDLLNLIALEASRKDLELKQVKNACDFALTCSDEMVVNLFMSLLDIDNTDNLRMFHKFIGKKVTAVSNRTNNV